MAHKYYQPTEYEEMMLAAGWLTMADLDDEYQEYVRKDDEPMSYDGWTNCKREWDLLNTTYELIIDPAFRYRELVDDERIAQKSLLDRMSWLECILGY